MAAMLSKEDAITQAVTMHNQKVPFAKIASHLAPLYTSSRTGKPLGEGQVRLLVMAALDSEKKELKDERIKVSASSKVMHGTDAIAAIMGIKNIPDTLRMKLLKVIVNDADEGTDARSKK